MLANLMTTLLLAFGVATGNVSSNVYKGGNAFNHELTEHEKKPNTKNAEYTYEKIIEYAQTDILYGPRINPNLPYTEYEYRKYLLKDDNGQPTQNRILPNFIITNTMYNFEFYRTPNNYNDWYMLDQAVVLKIKNVYEGTNRFRCKLDVTMRNNNNTWNQMYTSTDDLTNSLINMTITSNAKNNFYDIFNRINKTNLQRTATTTQTPNTNNYDIEVQSAEITLEKGEEIYLISIITAGIVGNGTAQNDIVQVYQNITINADYIAPDINYEIVDIPNLMYTILTMPFAFYSTAFNLTIFPNTAYSVNFGNLILTILGALILFYLIKKVVK